MSVYKKIKQLLRIESKAKLDSFEPVDVKVDLLSRLQFARHAPFGEALEAAGAIDPNSMNWVIPPVGIGGGGHLNIFRMVANLESLGFSSRIVIDGNSGFENSDCAKSFITQHYLEFNAPVYIGKQAMPPAWFTIATSWETAYTVRNFKTTYAKCYFVQDFEPWFFAAGSECALAEQTYGFDFLGITSGSWLARKLAEEYGMRTVSIGFSYDKGRYQQFPHAPRAKQRVFFYARFQTHRRGFELGLLALSDLKRRLPQIEVVLAGCDASAHAIPFEFINAGLLALDELPSLYSSCDVALVLSHTNLSLLPLELMACGCPVVSNNGPNVEWLLNHDVAMLAKPNVEALSEALATVLTNQELRQKLIRNGMKLAHSSDWLEQARISAAAFRMEQLK